MAETWGQNDQLAPGTDWGMKDTPVSTVDWGMEDKPVSEKTWLEVAKHGFDRAGIMMTKQLAGIAKIEAEVGGKVREWAWEKTPLGKKPEYLRKLDEQLKGWSNTMLMGVEGYYDQHPEEAIQVTPNQGFLSTLGQYVFEPKNLVQGLIESVPLMLEGILGTLTGGAGLAIPAMATPISGEVYADARKQDTDPLPAFAQATLTGFAEAAIEQWTLGKKIGLTKNFRKIVSKGLPSVLWEGTKAFFRGTAEEGSQEFNRNFWQWVFTDRDQPWTQNVMESAAAGGPMELAMSGVFSGAGAVGTVVSREQQIQRVENIREGINANEQLSDEHKAEINTELDRAVALVEEAVPVEAKPAETKAEGKVEYYHGTSMESAAKIEQEGFVAQMPDFGGGFAPNLVVGVKGVYLSGSKYGAQKFAKTHKKGTVLPVQAKLNKPFVIDNLTNKVIEQLEEKYVWSKVKSASPAQMSELLKEGLEAEGYDGIIIKKWQQGGMYGAKEPQVIVFDAANVTEAKPAPVEEAMPQKGQPITKTEKDTLREAGFSVSEILDMDPVDARAMMANPTIKAIDTSEQNPIPAQDREGITEPVVKDPGMWLKYMTSKRILMQRIGADRYTRELLDAKETLDVLKGTLNKEVNKATRALRRQANLGDRVASKIMNRQTKPVRRMVDLLDTYERLPDGIAKKLTPAEIDSFNKLRDITEWLLERTNPARIEAGLKPIGNIKAYIPHWYDTTVKEIIEGTHPQKFGYIGRLMKNVPKVIPNRTALHRMIKQKLQANMEQDLGTLMRGLISYDLHDMLLANPLAATWDELRQLRQDDKISDAAYNEVANYINYDILQKQAKLDKVFNRLVETPTEWVNKVLRPLHREISNPAKFYFGGFRKLMHAAFMPFRPRPVTRNLGQRLLNLSFFRARDLLRAQFGKQDVVIHPETGEQIKILDLIREQNWYKLTKPEDLLNDRTLLSRLTSVGMIGFKMSHVGNRYISNVEVSALTAYYDWKYRFNESHDTNSKHYKHIVEESEKTGVPIEQLQTQQADMMNDIRDGVQQTQWEYMSHNMPLIFRGQTKRGLAAYQSWWMNYFMSHTAEGWHRLLTGRTRVRGDGTGGRLLTPYARLRVVKGMGAVYGMAKLAKTTLGIVMLSALFLPDPTSGGSPLLQLAANMVKIFLGTSGEKKQAWRDIKRLAVHLMPFSNAIRDIAKLDEDWTLKDYVFYTENKEWQQIWVPVKKEKKKTVPTPSGGYIL